MSVELGSAFGRIVLDASDALKATEQVGRSLTGLASGPVSAVGSALTTMGHVALGGLGVAAAGATALGAGIVKMASDAAAVPGITSSFEELTASMTGGSSAMLAALQDSSNGLITNTDLMQSYNLAAALVGDEFAERLPDAMEYVSRVSAATGQDMGFMLDSLVKGVGRLSPMILDNLGIQVSLTEAYDAYAESVGKSADELTKAEQQTAVMNAVMEKLAENTEGMAGMSNPFTSFRVAVQNLKDEIGVKFLPVFQPLIEKFLELAQGIIPILLEKVQGFADVLSTAAGTVLSFISNLQQGMSPLDAFIEAIWEIAPPELLNALTDFRDNVLPGLMARFTEMKDRVMEIVTPIAEAITQFVSWKDVLIAAGLGIAAVLIPAIISIVTSLAPILLAVGAVIAVVALLRNAWENNWVDIQGKTQAVIDFIRPLIQNALAAIRQWWDENGAAIMAAVQTAWNTIQTVISTILTGISTGISTALANIRAWWDEHGEAIKTTAEQAWGLIKGVIDGTVEQIKKIVELFRLAFEGDWRGFGEKLREIWETAWKTMVTFLSGLWNMVRPKLVEMWERIKTWFRDTDWKQLGIDIIAGLINGVTSMISDAVNAAVSVGTAISDAFKGFFGIESPSKLMYEFGVNLGQGLINGIQAMTNEVGAAIDDMTGLIFDAMGKLSGLGGAFGGIFQGNTLDPLQREIDAIGAQIGGLDDGIERMQETLGLNINDPMGYRRMLQLINDPLADAATRDTARTLLAFWEERGRLEGEQVDLQNTLIEQQERLNALQERQAQLGFLQQQYELLKLIADNNLSTSILEGLTFGLDADAGALMDAMTAAMTEMVGAAEEALGIHSPSAVFRRIAGQIKEGLLTEISDTRSLVMATREMVGEMVGSAEGAVRHTMTDASRTLHVYGGIQAYIQQPQRAWLDDIQVMLTP